MVVVPSTGLVTWTEMVPLPWACTQKPATPPRSGTRPGPSRLPAPATAILDRLEEIGQQVAGLIKRPDDDAHRVGRPDRLGIGDDLERGRHRIGAELHGLDRLAADIAGDGGVFPLHAPQAQLLTAEVAAVENEPAHAADAGRSPGRARSAWAHGRHSAARSRRNW